MAGPRLVVGAVQDVQRPRHLATSTGPTHRPGWVVIGTQVASGIPARHMKCALALLVAISGLAPMCHVLT